MHVCVYMCVCVPAAAASNWQVEQIDVTATVTIRQQMSVQHFSNAARRCDW